MDSTIAQPQNISLIMDRFEKIILALYSHDLINIYDLTMPIYALMDQVLTPDQRYVLLKRIENSLRIRRLGIE